MFDTLLAEQLLAASGIVVALGILGRGMLKIYQTARVIDEVHHLASSQLRPNGGGSVVDQLARIETKVDGLNARVTTLEER